MRKCIKYFIIKFSIFIVKKLFADHAIKAQFNLYIYLFIYLRKINLKEIMFAALQITCKIRL